VDGGLAERHFGLGFGAQREGAADVVALAGPLGQVLVGGVLGAFPDGDVHGAALGVDFLDGLEVAAGGLAAAVGASVFALGAAPVGDLGLVDDEDDGPEPFVGVGHLAGDAVGGAGLFEEGDALLHLVDAPLDHVGGLGDVLVGGALDEDLGE